MNGASPNDTEHADLEPMGTIYMGALTARAVRELGEAWAAGLVGSGDPLIPAEEERVLGELFDQFAERPGSDRGQ